MPPTRGRCAGFRATHPEVRRIGVDTWSGMACSKLAGTLRAVMGRLTLPAWLRVLGWDRRTRR